MTKFRALISCILFCALALIAVSCGSSGGSGGSDNDEQLLQMDTFDLADDQLQLDLRGPDSGGSVAVTYFVFGSHENLGNETDVPLFPSRLEERSVATLALGESLDDVDLSDWAEYEFVYLRAVPCEPQIIVLLEPGKHYIFSTS
jgi:hypothetical protein